MLFFLSQVVGVRVLFLFFTSNTEKNTKAFISVSFDFYFERKGKREDYENAFLSTTAMLVRNRKKISPHSIFEGKSLVSVLFLQYWKKRMDQAWFHLKNLDLNLLHTVYIQTPNPLLDSRVQFWIFRKKHSLISFVFVFVFYFLLHPIDNTLVVQYRLVQGWLNYVYIIKRKKVRVEKGTL